jgi:hypothetical protein
MRNQDEDRMRRSGNDSRNNFLALRAEAGEHYCETLDLKQYPVGQLQIIDTYAEPNEMLCGMPGRHKHKRGCFVCAPDGKITNIGRLCAASHLGEEWKIIERRFNERSRDLAAFEKVEEFLGQADAWTSRVNGELLNCERGIWWISRCQVALSQRLPPKVLEALRDKFRSGNGEVTELDNRDQDDWGLAQLAYRRASGSAVRKLGEIAALDGGRSIRLNQVRSELIEPLMRYRQFSSPYKMKSAVRMACVGFFGSLPQQFASGERLVRDGRRFFSESNFLEIAKLARGPDRARVMGVWTHIQSLPTKPC